MLKRLTYIIAALILVSGPLAALEPVWKTIEASNTAISGFNGERQTLEFPRTSGEALSLIWTKERQDKPCFISIGSRNLDAGSNREGARRSADRCTKTVTLNPTLDMIVVGFADNPRYFIRGIAVCSSKEGRNATRVKGIEIFAAKVWQAKRRIDELETKIRDTKINCGTWQSPVYCKTGHVANGINVYWNKDDEIVRPRSALPSCCVARVAGRSSASLAGAFGYDRRGISTKFDEMIGIDTNVLLRYLLNDDKVQSRMQQNSSKTVARF